MVRRGQLGRSGLRTATPASATREGCRVAPRSFAQQRPMVALTGWERQGKRVNLGLCRELAGTTSASATMVSSFALLNPRQWQPP